MPLAPASRRALLGVSAFTPLALPLCRLWLSADRIAQADGSQVATWPDLSPAQNHATQSTAGLRPLLRAGVVNGKPAVEFDTADDILSTGAYGYVLNGNPLSIAVVASIGGSSGAYNGIITNRVGGSGDWLTFGEHNTDKVYIEARNASSVTNQNTAVNDRGSGVHLYVLVKTATSTDLYRNGVSIASTASDIGGGSLTTLYWSLGQWFAGGQNLGGYITELAIWHRALTTGERGRVERYLAARYGIAL